MESADNLWKDITRKYFSDTWVKNETGAMKTLRAQQKQLPISVADARAQVLRLKQQSLSVVKKGQPLV